jgi:hypothetical protein
MPQVVTFLAVFWRCLVQILVKTPATLAIVPHSPKSSAGKYLRTPTTLASFPQSLKSDAGKYLKLGLICFLPYPF